LTGEALAKRKDLTWKEMTQFSFSARVSTNPEKSRQSRMLLAVKRAGIAYVATAKKDAGNNVHHVFSHCYMQLDYTPNEYNAMQPAASYDL